MYSGKRVVMEKIKQALTGESRRRKHVRRPDGAYDTTGSTDRISTSSSSSSSSENERPVCHRETFTETEDRPVIKERVERIIVHQPVEKQFVVETRPVAEKELTEAIHYESAGVREYEIDRVAGSTCPTSGSVNAPMS